MKSNFLRLLAFALCFATIFAFVACNDGQGSETEDTTEGTTVSDETTVDGSDETTKAEDETVSTELTVEESNGVAVVTTATGLVYTASGYDSINGGSFVITSSLELNFSEDNFAEKFNRMTLNYRANDPVRIYVTYLSQANETVVADFFIEEGTGSFSGLILDYLNKKTATSISKIVVEPCKGKKMSFALYDLSTEKIASYIGNYGNTKFYINNERFKLGVDMSWGGAICYLEDLKANVEGLTNLVNKHDEGRLIQQSYYGTPTIPGVYEPGEFNNAQWNYNPVQGGDKYGNDSRIIDIVVTENSIYIKCQPQDWSLNGAITPSYMENHYILHEDYVEVKNRFVDFSGWTHPMTTQELPAFYTVSGLDTFVWYGGTDPWTGGELSYESDLNFWGDPQYSASCTFTIRQSNTETWCAWVNAATGFGMGVYVPNTDVLYAGRSGYNGSMDADDDACGYVAPLKKIRLVSYEALEYSYLIATGSIEEIRATFTENKDFTANESLNNNSTSLRAPDGDLDFEFMDFSKEKYILALTNHNMVDVEFDATEGALKATVSGGDPFSAIPFHTSQTVYNANDYTVIEIVYMIPTTNSAGPCSMELFLSTGNTSKAQAGKSVVRSLVADGQYHTLTVEVSGLAFWSGKINEIRLDYFASGRNGDVIYIKSIEFK